jgi:hypothetical protein
VKAVLFFSFERARCFGCGRELKSLNWQDYPFGKDDGLDEHLRIIARKVAERKEAAAKKD